MESIREFFPWLNSRLQLFIFGSQKAKFGIYVQALFVRVEAEFDTPLRSDALAWVFWPAEHKNVGRFFGGLMPEWNILYFFLGLDRSLLEQTLEKEQYKICQERTLKRFFFVVCLHFNCVELYGCFRK